MQTLGLSKIELEPIVNKIVRVFVVFKPFVGHCRTNSVFVYAYTFWQRLDSHQGSPQKHKRLQIRCSTHHLHNRHRHRFPLL